MMWQPGRRKGFDVAASVVPRACRSANVVRKEAPRLGALWIALACSAACGGPHGPASAGPQAPPVPAPATSTGPSGSAPKPPSSSTEAGGAAAQAPDRGCAEGRALCTGSKPFCCELVDDVGEYRGLSECVASYDDCVSTEFACTHQNNRCPVNQGIVTTGCVDQDPAFQLVNASGENRFDCAAGRVCRCQFRLLHNETYHEAAPQ